MAAQKLTVFTWDGTVQGHKDLPGWIFDVPLRRDVIHRVVVWQLAKRRQGTAKTKDRAEVSGSTRKIAPQKGRGAARHGDRRAPQFRKGGRAHGPRPRDYDYTLPRKIRRLGLQVALSAKLAEGKLVLLATPEVDSHKTATLAQMWASLLGPPGRGWRAKAETYRNLLVVDADSEQAAGHSLAARRGSQNLQWVEFLPQRGLNVYDILRKDGALESFASGDSDDYINLFVRTIPVLVMTVAAVDELEQRLSRPINR